MLLQQTTKYILKIYQKLGKGKSFQNNSLSFLMDSIDIPENPTKDDFQNL